MTLDFRLLPAAVPRETGRVLGGALLGPGLAVAPDWPAQRLPAPLFGSAEPGWQEIWTYDGPPALDGRTGDIRWRRAGDLLYGVLEVDEAAFASAERPLQAASEAAYRSLFALLDELGLPHLWRVWNYLAGINHETHGLERYRQFNIGRHEAFLACRRGAIGNVPAACALGLAAGPLSIAFLAADRPALPIENPRQVSAYHYPADYGPRSPTFSRAALAYPPGRELLLVSGTASIVGHQTVHPGDAAGQCRESLANIAALLAEAGRRGRGTYALADLSYRVYVRHAADFPAIREVFAAACGTAEAVFVQADICRADLLVEIEAMAAHVLEAA